MLPVTSLCWFTPFCVAEPQTVRVEELAVTVAVSQSGQSHVKRRSPVCVRRWTVRSAFRVNDRPQSGQSHVTDP